MHDFVRCLISHEADDWRYLITSSMWNLKGEPAMPGGAGNSQKYE